jgi:MFS family permease
VLGREAGLGPIATGATVSLLALVAAFVQPRAGHALDAGRLGQGAAGLGLAVAAIGLVFAALVHSPAPLTLAAALIGLGVGTSTPLAFAALANAAPEGRLGQTMGAGEVGRELGDAGGPLLVGAISPIGLSVALLGLAVAVGMSAAVGLRAGPIRQPQSL